MKKVLSIQSAVTLGFVGNSVAAPVLTAMGHHPLLVDTIKLAAHPGYGAKCGGVPAEADFAEILTALKTFDALADIELVITGYIGAVTQIAPISEMLGQWRAVVPDGHYILDPVIGDAGTLYVTEQIADGIATTLLPLASLVTPNRFELSHLSGVTINDFEDAARAGAILLGQNPALRAVIATAIPRLVGPADAPMEIGDMLISRNVEPLWMPATQIDAAEPKNLPGGGDLLTALLAGHLANGLDLPGAVKAASPMAQTLIAHSSGSRDLALLRQIDKIHKKDAKG